LNKENGSLVWNYPLGVVSMSSPTVANGRVYVGSDNKKLYCFNATTGVLQWTYSIGSWIFGTPSVAYGNVYFGSWDDHSLYCVDAIGNSNGTTNLMWKYTTGSVVYTSPAIADYKVYFPSYDTNFYCLDALTGQKLWNYSIGGHPKSSPAIVDGKVYIGDDEGGLYSFGWGNVPPNPAYHPYPQNGMMKNFHDLNLSWTGLDRNPLDTMLYDVYFGTSSTPPLVASNLTNMTYHIGYLEQNMTYYWRIVTWDNHGTSSESPTWEFTNCSLYNDWLDTYNLTFSLGGSADWFGQNQYYYYGDSAVQSGNISASQSTIIKSVVNGPGILTFYWNVSSHSGYDYLQFLVDGSWKSQISGLVLWEQKHYNISEGIHEISWKYYRCIYDGVNLNCGWVDDIEWINGTPAIPDCPSGPMKLIIGDNGLYTTRSLDLHGRQIQYRYDWNASENHSYSNWTDFHPSEDNVSLSHNWSYNGTFVIKVQARNTYGFTSNWSNGLVVNVVANQLPSQPILSGPRYGRPTIEYNFTVKCNDPEGEDVFYKVAWGDGSNSTTWLGPYPSNQSQVFSHQWAHDGFYNVTVKSKDARGAVSNWSSPFHFTVDSEPPSIVILKPLPRHLYLFDRFTMGFPGLLAIGHITFKVNASDTFTEIQKVVFSLDNVSLSVDITSPYEWTWSAKARFKHTVTISVYDNAGNTNTQDINIWKFG
jgi:hypothetical protein